MLSLIHIFPWAEGNAPAEYGQLIATRQAGNRWQASEGPEIIYNPQTEYYYLFMACLLYTSRCV